MLWASPGAVGRDHGPDHAIPLGALRVNKTCVLEEVVPSEGIQDVHTQSSLLERQLHKKGAGPRVHHCLPSNKDSWAYSRCLIKAC